MWKTTGNIVGWLLSLAAAVLAIFMAVRLAGCTPNDDTSVILIVLFPAAAAAILFNPLVFSRLPSRLLAIRLLLAGIAIVAGIGTGYYADRLTPNGMAYLAQDYHDGRTRPKDIAKAIEL